MTKSGVERDLKKTPYVAIISYHNKKVTYCFSSHTALTKFEQDLEKNRAEIKESLSARFKIEFFISQDFCDIILYKKIERRGFLIYIGEDEVQWPGELIYKGIQVTQKS